MVRRTRLLVAKLDRLRRRAADILRLLDEPRVDFTIADMPNATPLAVGIMAVLAEDEAKRIRERTKAALAAAKARGVQLGSPERLRHADPRERARASAAVRSAKAGRFAEDLGEVVDELRAEGATSLRALAAGLNERGLRTPRGVTVDRGRSAEGAVEARVTRRGARRSTVPT